MAQPAKKKSFPLKLLLIAGLVILALTDFTKFCFVSVSIWLWLEYKDSKVQKIKKAKKKFEDIVDRLKQRMGR